jgi:hypothetical protein
MTGDNKFEAKIFMIDKFTTKVEEMFKRKEQAST